MGGKYIINSISDYLNLIKNEGLYDYILRGQNQEFNGIEASGFRPYRGGWYTDSFYNLEEMKDQFYNKVVRRISDDEKKHFLAFCQHHGLPTNLVDFTTSPLISLFFACHGKQAFSEDSKSNEPEAEVYFIKKERLVDITSLLLEYKNENFFECLLEDKGFREKVISKLENLFFKCSNKLIIYISNLIKCYEANDLDIYGESISEKDEDEEYSSQKFYEFSDFIEQPDLIKLYYYLYNHIEDEGITHGDTYHLEGPEYCSNQEIAARVYLALLINLIQIQRDKDKKLNIDLDVYFTYQPPDLFDRIIYQKGLFIYQPYLSNIEEIYNYRILSYQSIKADYVIKIRNHTEIINELNFLGVNLESIYGDFDNVAKSIKFNHDLVVSAKNRYYAQSQVNKLHFHDL